MGKFQQNVREALRGAGLDIHRDWTEGVDMAGVPTVGITGDSKSIILSVEIPSPPEPGSEVSVVWVQLREPTPDEQNGLEKLSKLPVIDDSHGSAAVH